MKSPDVSILIISFNTRPYTLQCLQSIYEQTDRVDFEVIVLDNGSVDGSADAIAQQFPQVHLIREERNLGFARGNNQAALRAKGRYLLLLNPDTKILDHAIDQIVEFADSRPKAGIYTGCNLSPEGGFNRNCYGKMTPWSLFCRTFGLTKIGKRIPFLNPETYGNWNYDQIRTVDIVEGSFLLIQRALWDQLGGFNPLFFMYGEEVDLCLRARKAGYRPICCPQVRIIHYGGCSETCRADQVIKTLRGEVTILQEHWSPVSRWFGIKMFLLRVFLKRTILTIWAFFQSKKQADAAVWQEVWEKRKQWIKGWHLQNRNEETQSI